MTIPTYNVMNLCRLSNDIYERTMNSSNQNLYSGSSDERSLTMDEACTRDPLLEKRHEEKDLDYDSIPSYSVLNQCGLSNNTEYKINSAQNTSKQDLHNVSSDEESTMDTDDTHTTDPLDGKISNRSIKHLSPEQRAEKLKRWRARHFERMSCETPEERELRERRNLLNRMKLANESPEQRNLRLKKLREYQRNRLRNETPEERQRRLTKMKEYSRTSRRETPEQRKERINKSNNQFKYEPISVKTEELSFEDNKEI